MLFSILFQSGINCANFKKQKFYYFKVLFLTLLIFKLMFSSLVIIIIGAIQLLYHLALKLHCPCLGIYLILLFFFFVLVFFFFCFSIFFCFSRFFFLVSILPSRGIELLVIVGSICETSSTDSVKMGGQ